MKIKDIREKYDPVQHANRAQIDLYDKVTKKLIGYIKADDLAFNNSKNTDIKITLII